MGLGPPSGRFAQPWWRDQSRIGPYVGSYFPLVPYFWALLWALLQHAQILLLLWQHGGQRPALRPLAPVVDGEIRCGAQITDCQRNNQRDCQRSNQISNRKECIDPTSQTAKEANYIGPDPLGFWFWTYGALPIGPIGP